MGQSIALGAAHEFLQFKFGGQFEERESTPAMSVNASSAVGNNPDRLGLLIINTGASSVTLGLSPSVVSGAGIILAANGGAVSFDVDEDFTVVTRQFFGVAASGAPSLYVLELNRSVFLPRREGSDQ